MPASELPVTGAGPQSGSKTVSFAVLQNGRTSLFLGSELHGDWSAHWSRPLVLERIVLEQAEGSEAALHHGDQEKAILSLSCPCFKNQQRRRVGRWAGIVGGRAGRDGGQ